MVRKDVPCFCWFFYRLVWVVQSEGKDFVAMDKVDVVDFIGAVFV
jgi:hypothetical protein